MINFRVINADFICGINKGCAWSQNVIFRFLERSAKVRVTVREPENNVLSP